MKKRHILNRLGLYLVASSIKYVEMWTCVCILACLVELAT